MKKYLMTAVAALALGGLFTNCTKEDFANSASEDILQQYEQVFTTAFGTPAPNQTWGFGENTTANTRAMTRSNPGETYPATHTYANGGANANANEWADPDKEFGGWVVPDPLTEGQKLRVKMYFQANPNLAYEDPHFRHFFVQQVYKGGTNPGSNSTEEVIAADGSSYTSDNMNHLTVGQSNMHINNFNTGTCTTNNTVLDNGGNVNSGPYHSDEIMLMVNIDDTSCFGYHDSGSSNQSDDSPNHNDKMALVSAATIDAWAAKNGNPGAAVVDKWNRSFMGFDLAIKEGEQAYERDNNGNVIYATYSQAAESPRFAWDGEKIIEIAEQSQATGWQVVYKEGYETIQNLGWLTTNKNFYIAADQVTMSQTISMNRAQASTITTIQNAPVLKDVMVGDTYYQSVINLPRIKQLVDDGYLPVNNKSLTEWVKVGKSDGYFSDWIVTLTEAQRIDEDDKEADPDIVRIIAEDLTWGSENGDFDFNDVVFDVKLSEDKQTITITLLAAGGTLPLRIAGQYEVHEKFGVPTGTMVNTGTQLSVTKPKQTWSFPNSDSRNYKLEDGKEVAQSYGSTVKEVAYNLPVEVYKLINGTKVWVELQAPVGKAAAKVAVDNLYQWCDERQSIDAKYYDSSRSKGKFSMYVRMEEPYDKPDAWNTWYK